jgi:hypothetical protein
VRAGQEAEQTFDESRVDVELKRAAVWRNQIAKRTVAPGREWVVTGPYQQHK